MARIVRRTAVEPSRVVIDGSHKLTRGEQAGRLYWYDEAGARHEAGVAFPDMRGD